MLLALIGISMLCMPVPQAAADEPADVVVLKPLPDGAPRPMVVVGDEHGPGIMVVKELKGAEVADEPADAPKVWIGVRVTPVPAPLAAHIGKGGVLVANVVEGSPADQAGIQQYDVVVGFGGQDLDEPGDLTGAVAAAAPGKAVRLSVIRQGKSQTIEIRPVDRPQGGMWEHKLKYEEPEDVLVDSAVKMRHRALQKGPGGEWMLRDLGPLEGLPEALEKLKDLDIRVDVDPHSFMPDVDVRILRDLDEAFVAQDEEDGERQIEVRVQVEDDGTSTTINRDADGKITVTKRDADGKETSATYDSADALEESDPETFKLYRPHAGMRGAMFHVRPFDQDWHHGLKIDIQKRVEEAMERAREAGASAREKHKEALEELEKHVQRKRVEIRHHGEGGEGGEAGEQRIIVRREKEDSGRDENVMVRVAPDGSISVTVEDRGTQAKYEFKSKQDFKQREPELYGRVQELLE